MTPAVTKTIPAKVVDEPGNNTRTSGLPENTDTHLPEDLKANREVTPDASPQLSHPVHLGRHGTQQKLAPLFSRVEQKSGIRTRPTHNSGNSKSKTRRCNKTQDEFQQTLDRFLTGRSSPDLELS